MNIALQNDQKELLKGLPNLVTVTNLVIIALKLPKKRKKYAYILNTYLFHDYYISMIRKWKSDSSNYDSETDKEEVPRSKSLATIRRQKQPVRRPTTKVNPRYKKKDNSFSANSDDEDYGKSR